MKYLAPIVCVILTGCLAASLGPRQIKPTEPYQNVGVLYENLRPVCTVTLIDACVVISAAHCFYDKANTTFNTVSFDGIEHYVVTSYQRRPEWAGIEPDPWDNDLALATLHKAPPIVPADWRRTPIDLSNYDDRIVVVGRADGSKRWQRRWILGKLESTDLIMWADPYSFLIDGDSGGPLFMDDELVGINVMGIWEGKEKKPVWNISLSTDIGQHTEWIDDYLEPDPG